MAVWVQLLEAVVTELNSGGFSQPFTAARHYLPKFDLKETASLVVAVAPRSFTSEVLSRERDQETLGVDVGVLKRLASEAASEIDPLVNLVQELKDRFRAKSITTPAAVCTEIVIDPLYDIDFLDQKRQFVSVLQLSWTLIR
jgi:hypothetical protein